MAYFWEGWDTTDSRIVKIKPFLDRRCLRSEVASKARLDYAQDRIE